MGLLDYYRQFEGMSEEEVNAELREQAAERRRKALTRVETLDLSLTTWPELPHPRVVAAITYVARRGLHRYPQLSGSDLRGALAERHGVDPERLILGNGAADLLSAATRALLEPGQQLLTHWPSYPLYPIMARRAHGRAVRVGGGSADGKAGAGGSASAGVDALLEAAAREPDVRAIAIASPNDPTGELLPAAELRRLLEQLPAGIAVLLDEALVEFADAQPTSASLELLEQHPSLLVFRSFSKAWGLAGLRIGYAIGAPGSGELLAELAPDLGVSEISQAGAFEALHSCSELLDANVRTICDERPRLIAALRERGFEVAGSQANFVWAAHPAVPGGELAARLARAGVLVAAGDALGAPQHVRIAIRSAAATDRLLGAIDKAL
ncbi:MAG: histidinol-phosphate transaminase [Solirubrobacteraceae bacterium]|jgi:histidinol-phosphate aminotransferase